MPVYYKSKIKYPAVVDGQATYLTEIYLHEAITYGEVEQQIPDILKTRIKTWDEDTVDGINKIKFNAVVWHAQQEEDAFYQVKVTMYFEKKTKYIYLVPAIDYRQAGERMEENLKGSLAVYEITHVDKSDVLAFWHPKNELWQGDWWNRMERYYDEGKYEAGHTDVSTDADEQQTELDIVNDFRVKDPGEEVPGVKKASRRKVEKAIKNLKTTLQETADKWGASEITARALDTDGNVVKSVTIKGKNIVFRKENGDPVE